MYSTEEIKDFEDNTDFIVVCESPFEIECTVDGSTANGQCAEMIIEGYFRSC